MAELDESHYVCWRLGGSKNIRSDVTHRVESIVVAASELAYKASRLANIISWNYLHLVDNWNLIFARSLVSAAISGASQFESITLALQEYPLALADVTASDLRGDITQQVARELNTAIKRHVNRDALLRELRNLIYALAPSRRLGRRWARFAKRGLNGHFIEEQQLALVNLVCIDIRNICNIADGEPFPSAVPIIRGLRSLKRVLSSGSELESVRRCTLIPLAKPRRRHVAFTAKMAYLTLIYSGVEGFSTHSTAAAEINFRLRDPQFKREVLARVFGADAFDERVVSILTDTVSVIARLRLPVPPDVQPQIAHAIAGVPSRRRATEIRNDIVRQHRTAADYPSTRLIGVDPGRSTIVYLSERATDEAGEIHLHTHKLTRAEYYRRLNVSGRMRKSRKIRRKNGLAEIEAALSVNPPRTATADGFRSYMQALAPVADTILHDGLKRKHSRDRFHWEGKKRSIIDTFFQTVYENDPNPENGIPRRPRYAWGNGAFASVGRGERGGVPKSAIKMRCAQRFFVFDVEEFGTSRVCSRCCFLQPDPNDTDNDVTLAPVRQKFGHLARPGGFRTSLRSVKFCKNLRHEGHLRLCERDCNAATNILFLGIISEGGGERPQIFQRVIPNEEGGPEQRRRYRRHRAKVVKTYSQQHAEHLLQARQDRLNQNIVAQYAYH